MNHTKILDSGNVQLVLSPEDALYLASLLGHHVRGSGHSRIVNGRIYGQLSALGYIGNPLSTQDVIQFGYEGE